MKKIMALDVGDQWIGVALSDPLGLIARPYKTVRAQELEPFLKEFLASEAIDTIVIGYPKTMSGGHSDQTKKVLTSMQQLQQVFTAITFVLWDERLSSKRAQQLGSRKTPQEKQHVHARAAAFILDSYLLYRTPHS